MTDSIANLRSTIFFFGLTSLLLAIVALFTPGWRTYDNEKAKEGLVVNHGNVSLFSSLVLFLVTL